MTIQDQYIDSFRQAQEAWVDVVKSFTSEAQRVTGQPWTPFSFVDPDQAIDQVFDFWTESLEVQRNITKQVIGATIAAGQKFQEQVESLSTPVR